MHMANSRTRRVKSYESVGSGASGPGFGHQRGCLLTPWPWHSFPPKKWGRGAPASCEQVQGWKCTQSLLDLADFSRVPTVSWAPCRVPRLPDREGRSWDALPGRLRAGRSGLTAVSSLSHMFCHHWLHFVQEPLRQGEGKALAHGQQREGGRASQMSLMSDWRARSGLHTAPSGSQHPAGAQCQPLGAFL